MKKIFLLLALLSLPTYAQYAHRSNPGTPGGAAPAITSAGSGNCPGTGCVSVNTAGASTMIVKIAGTWTATLSFRCSNDTWTTRDNQTAYPLTNGIAGAGVTTTAANGTWRVPTAGYLSCGVFADAFTSNTSMTINLDADPAPTPAGAQPVSGSVTVLGSNGSAAAQDGVSNNLVTNVALNNVAPDVGSGTTGTGTQRIVIANDDTVSTAQFGVGFNAAPLAPRYCDKRIAFTTLGTTATVQQIAAVASQHIYICGWQLFGSTATTGVDLTWSEGTGANCVTGTATIGGKFLTTPTAAPANSPNSTWGPGSIAQRWTGTAGDALCITQSATANSTLLAGTIFYTQN